MRLVFVALIATVIGGCATRSQDEGHLEYGSIGDVRALLGKGGAPAVPLACTNVRHPTGEVIRSIACATTLQSSMLETLVSTFSMDPGTAFHGQMRNACESRPGLRSADPGVEVYVGENRHVQNGVGRIEIHVVRATGNACVEITYPWG